MCLSKNHMAGLDFMARLGIRPRALVQAATKSRGEVDIAKVVHDPIYTPHVIHRTEFSRNHSKLHW